MIRSANILLVDDHPMLRNGLVALLRESGGFERVIEASSPAEAMAKAKPHQLDIALIDLNMGGQLSLNLLDQLKQEKPSIRVIVYSMHEEPHIIRRMKRAGASGYVFKSAPHQQVLDAVKAAFMGKEFWPDQVLDILNNAAAPLVDEETGVNISRREREVLLLVAQEYSNSQIADQLGMSQRTVETHKRNLTRKLGVRNMVGLVRYALENEESLQAGLAG